MDIRISGHHVDLDPALSEHVKASLTKISDKYKDNAVSAAVHFDKDAHAIKCDINFNSGYGGHKPWIGIAESLDAYKSFDKALAKLKSQILKFKNKSKPQHAYKASELICTN
ncbi:MAG: ribosome-associated translation inhibitor RaiA [Rickettsiaceae bacterium]|nr:ribosome-associated translation inhibitor RaiA [Rickettsiaceae bacterium]